MTSESNEGQSQSTALLKTLADSNDSQGSGCISDGERGHLVRALLSQAADCRVLDARMGLFWNAVQTEVGAALTANPYTWFPPSLEGPINRWVGRLLGRSSHELVQELLLEEDRQPCERALGLAVLNASLQADSAGWGNEHFEEVILRLGRGRRVATLGHFHLSAALRQELAGLEVFELSHRLRPGDQDVRRMQQVLPEIELLALTATVLYTADLNAILAQVNPDAQLILAGPSAPLHPMLHDWGFCAVSGSIVEEPAAVLRGVSEGATHSQLEGLRKVTMLRDVHAAR